MEDMYKEIATVNFSKLELEEITALFEDFPFFKEMGRRAEELEDLGFYFQLCVSSLLQLKNNPQYGDLYYDIIVHKIIENSNETNEEIARRYKISVPTYYAKRIEAVNYTYEIWFGEGLTKFAESTSGIPEEVLNCNKDVIRKNTKDNLK